MPVQNTRPTRDPSRARRTMLTLAAAAAVVLLPTACDYAVAEAGSYDIPSGHSGHGGAPTVSDVETVPAGVTEDLAPEPDPTEPDPTEPDPTEPDPADLGTGEESEVPEAGGGSAEPDPASSATETTDETTRPTSTTETSTTDTSTTETSTSTAPPVVTPPAPAPPAILGNDCSASDLDPHTGFQDAPRCVAIAFGEVAAAALSPSLLITDAPRRVASGQPFTLTVSTRNLVRDRFLGAAAGGYYRESSFLTEEGIQRGHFHTACRLLPNLTEAPNAEPVPAFFLATQDNGGGATPDQVVVPVTPITGQGILQCAVWAGDGSHRVPMMQRANQTPAFDIVRIRIG